MMAGIDEVEKLPTNQTPVNKPASGTYGEGAALQGLKSALPGVAASPGQGSSAPSQVSDKPVTPARSSRSSAIPGVPAPILKPSTQPSMDVGAAPTPTAQMPMMTGAQRRMQILDQLANSPEVSEVTREWAQRVLNVLAG